VAIGIGLLGETPRAGAAGGIAAGFAVLVAALALAYLARSAPHGERARADDEAGVEDKTAAHDELPVLAGAAPPGR
jgi:hypothetical protein